MTDILWHYLKPNGLLYIAVSATACLREGQRIWISGHQSKLDNFNLLPLTIRMQNPNLYCVAAIDEFSPEKAMKAIQEGKFDE